MAKGTGLIGLENTLISLRDGQRDLLVRIKKLEQQIGKLNSRVPAKRGRPPKAAKAGKAGILRPGRKRLYQGCSTRGCENPHYSKGLCVNHYQQSRRDALKDDDGSTKKIRKRRGRKSKAVVKAAVPAKKTGGKKRGRPPAVKPVSIQAPPPPEAPQE